MQQFWYILVLVFSLSGMTYLDYQKKLLWFWNWRFTLRLLALNLMFFLAWDIVNINAGIIATNQAWVTGWYIFIQDLPIEEFLFLTLLGYQTALLWRWRCLRTV